MKKLLFVCFTLLCTSKSFGGEYTEAAAGGAISAVRLVILGICAMLAWTAIRYIGHWFGFFEDPSKTPIMSKIKLKKKEVKEEVEEEVEEEGWSFFTYVFVYGVVGVLLYWWFDINVFEILMKVIAGAIEGFNQP